MTKRSGWQLTDLRFHDLRHTWVSLHRQAGTSCDELKGTRRLEVACDFSTLYPIRYDSPCALTDPLRRDRFIGLDRRGEISRNFRSGSSTTSEYALGAVQYGGTPDSSKPWKGLGPGVREIVEDDAAGTYRAVYTLRFVKAGYVLHAFQKRHPEYERPARMSI